MKMPILICLLSGTALTTVILFVLFNQPLTERAPWQRSILLAVIFLGVVAVVYGGTGYWRQAKRTLQSRRELDKVELELPRPRRRPLTNQISQRRERRGRPCRYPRPATPNTPR